MDNMLYILAVLLILLLLIVLVMRRKQAQRFTSVDSRPKIASAKSRSMGFSNLEPKYADIPKKGATKFDNVTIAERFMDQQRYDKAIETLQRGLNEKPHDGPLLLKLLNVYVVANQYSDFDQVYHTLKAYGDQASIEQADQLKELISDEHATSLESPFSKDMSLDNQPSVEPAAEVSAARPFFDDGLSLDFDSDQALAADQPAVVNDKTSHRETSHRDSSNDAFDLTLDDLETTDLSNDTVEDSSPTVDTIKVDTLSSRPAPVANKVTLATVTNKAPNIDNDFTLDLGEFDNPVTENPSVSGHTEALSASRASDELNVMHDLTLESKNHPEKFKTNTPSHQDQPAAKPAVDAFALILESYDIDDDVMSDNTDTLSDDLALTVSKNSLARSVEDTLSPLDKPAFDKPAFDESAFEDLASNTSPSDDVALFDFNITDDSATASSKTGTSDSPPLTSKDNQSANKTVSLDDMRFDDNNGLDTDAMMAAFGSITNNQKAITANSLAPVKLDALLSKDFDYVRSLDSYQVTLELADHYLQLGEYDSAKRLLIEVIDQGNSKQQQKAQALLARTA